MCTNVFVVIVAVIVMKTMVRKETLGDFGWERWQLSCGGKWSAGTFEFKLVSELSFCSVTMPVITADSPTSLANGLYVRLPLFQHQERVLEAAVRLERNSSISVTNDQTFMSNVGFICCAPGAGKSIVMLALATQTIPTRTNRQINFSFSSGSVLQSNRPVVWGTLIVVPDLLVGQWAEYITRFTYCRPSEYLVIPKKQDIGACTILEQKVIVCSPEVYKAVSVQYHFHRVIFDEVDTINIPACTQPSANMIWCLSSNVCKIKTANVLNRGFLRKMLLEIKQVVDYYQYDIWQHLIIQTDNEYLIQSINIPTFQVDTKYYLPPLHPFTLQGFERYHQHGFLSKLGECYGIGVFDDWSSFQDNMLSTKMEAVRIREQQHSTTLQALHCIRDKLLFLQENHQYTNDVTKLFDEMTHITSRLSATEDCPITHAPIVCVGATKCCFNKFEASSLLFSVCQMGSCPLCRSELSSADIVLYSPTPIVPTPGIAASKEEVFKGTTLANYTHGRILIFAGAEYALAKRYLEEIGVTFAEFTGRVVNRCINKFAAGQPPILLVDYTRFSTGFNLTAATHLMLFEDTIDATLLQQIIGRAQRIGRSSPLQVVRFSQV